jgi:adenylate cyclase
MHWLARHRLSILAGICAFWTLLVLGLRFAINVPFLSTVWRSEQSFEDVLRREGRKTRTHQNFVFVGIDQESLKLTAVDPEEIERNRAFQLMTERPFPWSRELWVLLLDRLFQAGTRLVVFDLVFSPPDDGDAVFRAALDRYRDKVVIGANFDLSQAGGHGGAALNAVNVPPNASLIPPPQMEDDRVGYVIFFRDALDSTIRSARYTLTSSQLMREPPRPGETPHESLSARMLEKLGRGVDVPRDLDAHLIRFGAPSAYFPLPLWEIFDAKIWRANYKDGAFFKDKVVIVAPSAQIQHDFVDTPIDRNLHGGALHLHALAAALDHEFLRETPLGIDYALVCAAGALSWALIAFLRKPLVCLIALIAVGAAYLGLARLFYDRAGLFILVVPTLSVLLVSGLCCLVLDFALERIEKMRTRRTLERYVSRNLVNEILENPAAYHDTLRGVRKEVIILFSDIADFTTVSEKTQPEALVRQLNEYLSAMTSVVFEHEGTLDKFIGDSVMAVWGNVHSRGAAEDARLAARAALAMRESLRTLNAEWSAQGIQEFRSGIGLNHGEVIVGNIGSEQKMDFTVIGDAVNLASRIEALTRTYPADILVGPSVTNFLRDQFYLRSVGVAQVKGKLEAVEISALVAARDDDVDLEFFHRLEWYEEGLHKFRERDFAQAKSLFSRFLEFYPADELAKAYLSRAIEHEKVPPDENWSAVEVFTKK